MSFQFTKVITRLLLHPFTVIIFVDYSIQSARCLFTNFGGKNITSLLIEQMELRKHKFQTIEDFECARMIKEQYCQAALVNNKVLFQFRICHQITRFMILVTKSIIALNLYFKVQAVNIKVILSMITFALLS